MSFLPCFLLLFTVSSRVIGSTGMFPEWKELDEFRRGWYTQHLLAAEEQPISISADRSVYRFTWLRTFHNPMVIRIECSIRCQLQAKRLSGAGGYEPGEITERVTRQLADEEIQAFTRLFRTIDFWSGQPQTSRFGMDGAQWILQAAGDARYRAWDIWSPDDDSRFEAFREFCKFMIRLSGMKVPSDEVY